MINLDKVRYLYDQAVEQKELIKPIYNEVFELTDPFAIIEDGGKQSISASRDVDGDVLDAIGSLNSFIMSSVFSRRGEWAGAEIDKIKLKEIIGEEEAQKSIDEANRYLSQDISRVFSQIQSSNYYSEISKAINSYIKVGTGCFAIRETGLASKPFKFEYVGLDNLFILEDNFSHPSIVFKKHPEVNPDYLKDVFGSTVKLPNGVAEGDFTNEFDIYECVLPDYNEEEGITIYNYFILDGSMSEILLEKELNYQPIVVARWDVIEGNSWGKSTVLEMKAILKDISLYKEIYKTQARKIARPARGFVGNEKLFYELNLDEGAVNYFGDDTQGLSSPTIQDIGGNVNLMPLNGDIQEERARFKRALMNDQIGLQGSDGRYTSATAITIAHELFRQRFANTYELINSEIIEPTFIAPFIIMLENGSLNLKPNVIPFLAIQYKNELSKTSNSEKVNALVNYTQVVNQLQEANKAGVALNISKVIPFISEKMEINKEFVPNESELEEIKIQQAQIAQQQAQMAQQQAQGIGGVVPNGQQI